MASSEQTETHASITDCRSDTKQCCRSTLVLEKARWCNLRLQGPTRGHVDGSGQHGHSEILPINEPNLFMRDALAFLAFPLIVFVRVASLLLLIV